jgi:general secretion pathway protein D
LLALAACNDRGNDLATGSNAPTTASAAAVSKTPVAAPQSLVQPPITEILPERQVAPPVVQRGASPAPVQAPAAANAVQVAPGGDVTLNFAGADIREVAKVVLGDILGLNYTVDSALQGTVTVQTSHPLPRNAVLPTLQQVFAASGAAIIQENNLFRVVPLGGPKAAAAPQGGGAPAGAGNPALQAVTGFGMQVIPLQFASSADLQKLLAPFVPAGATVQADTTRNMLLVSGTQQDIQGVIELVRTFDVDWLAHTSFALIPLRAVPPQTIATEMTDIVGGQGTPDTPAAVRIVPVERLNAVLVITTQPRYLDWARNWVQRLDEGSEDDTQRTYVYHVQHGRAADLADVLGKVFGAPGRGSSGSNIASSTLSSPATGPSSAFGGGLQGGGILPSGGAFGGGGGGFGAGGGGFGGGIGNGGGSSAMAPLGGGSGSTALAPIGTGATGGAVNPSSSTSSGSGLGAGGITGSDGAGGPVRIVTDDRNNALVIVTTPRTYRQIEEALRRLDVEPRQVVIDATIAEVTLTNQLQYGLQWFFRQQNSNFAFLNNTTPAATAATSTTGTASTTSGTTSPASVASAAASQLLPGFSYLFSSSNIQIALNALSSITKVDVLSAPELLVLNNQTAQLQVGASVPVPVQQAQSVVTPGAPLVNTISYLDTGVILSVTPRANANGEITLDIEQDVSDAESTTSSQLDAPTVNQRRIKSSVDVQSGETIALGGLISTNRNSTRSSIPLLGDIPVVGNLFRNQNDIKTRTELLILIQPRVISNSSDARAATSDLINRMQYVQPFDTPKH